MASFEIRVTDQEKWHEQSNRPRLQSQHSSEESSFREPDGCGGPDRRI